MMQLRVFQYFSRDISLMKIIKSSGPRIDPWGTPDFIFNGFDFVPFMTTDCFLSLR